jgi:hypothetical protein
MLPYNIIRFIQGSQGFMPMPGSNKKRKTGKIQHHDTFVYTLLQNIYSQQGDRHIYAVYKIKEKRERGGEAYIHSCGKETIRDKFNKVQRYTHEKEPDRKGESKEKENWERLRKNLMCEGGRGEGGGRSSEERRMSVEWRAGRTRPVRYAAPRGRPGTPV